MTQRWKVTDAGSSGLERAENLGDKVAKKARDLELTMIDDTHSFDASA